MMDEETKITFTLDNLFCLKICGHEQPLEEKRHFLTN
jgi:hypothetical protein